MRNPLRRFVLVILSLLMAGVLLGSDVLAEPADAHRSRRSVTSFERRSATHRRSRVRTSRRVRRRSTPAVRPAVVTGDVWAALRRCESGGRYDINTGNGYYGAYQFHPRTWRGLGYAGLPHQAPPEIQDEAARKLQARSGWGQWPACARRLGLR